MIIKYPGLINTDFRVAIVIQLNRSRLGFLLLPIASLFIQNIVMGAFPSHITAWVNMLPREAPEWALEDVQGWPSY